MWVTASQFSSSARAILAAGRALVYSVVQSAHVNGIMDVLPSGNLFRELQDVTDTGYFEWKLSLEDYWQQVRRREAGGDGDRLECKRTS